MLNGSNASLREHDLHTSLFASVFGSIALLGLCANWLIVYVTLWHRYVLTRGSILIAILAICDLISNVGMLQVSLMQCVAFRTSSHV